MEFFTKKNFDDFSSLIDNKFTQNTSQSKLIKNTLTKNGVFDKTKYWAQLLGQEGYAIEGKMMWQFSGRVRKYSWAKVYLKGFENTDIYFTVGVGSRLVEDTSNCSLVYKIDCQRKRGKLSSYQLLAFDGYLNDNKLDWVKRIEAYELQDYSWERLIEETIEFINGFEVHYKDLVDLLWPNGVGILPKVARLCWNEYNWQRPSGESGKSVSKGHAFEKDKGYGYEEWLFDMDRVIDGVHYGFIQALNKGNHDGSIYDIHLYAIKRIVQKIPESKYYWIGRIKKAKVLTAEESREVLQEYKERGWYDEMRSELQNVDVEDFDFAPVKEDKIFNVAFEASSSGYVLFDEPIEVENPKSEISAGYHYVLSDLLKNTTSITNSSGVYRFKSGHNPTKTGSLNSSYTVTVANKVLLHKEIQEHIFKQLAKEYGEERAGTEVSTGNGTSIDIVLKDEGNKDIFYEVKTSGNAQKCIREALGQILEYSLYPEKFLCSKMIIVGPSEPNSSVKKYLAHLRDSTKLPVFYQVFNTSTKKLTAVLY